MTRVVIYLYCYYIVSYSVVLMDAFNHLRLLILVFLKIKKKNKQED